MKRHPILITPMFPRARIDLPSRAYLAGALNGGLAIATLAIVAALFAF